jgi:RnfABCDGE-type electron transport complex B subunit
MLPVISHWLMQLVIGTSLFLIITYALLKINRYLRKQLTTQKFLVNRINRALPQTQCGQCGHPGCLPYARSISLGEASNKCPPGGIETIQELAELLNEPVRGLDPAHGQFRDFSVAVIREDECIGCTKCIQACPVDAILGGPKLMHTVIASECTGCDLCVEPCPVDCIDMIYQLAPSISHTTTPSLDRLSSSGVTS